MVNLFKGWLKIYLFYGTIFFLLGLFGFLASDHEHWIAWSSRQFASINRLWTLMTVSEKEEQTVPAFTSRFDTIVIHVYRPKDANLQFDNLLQRLQTLFRKKFQRVIVLPVLNLKSFALEVGNPSLPSILVGYDQTPNTGQDTRGFQNVLYFGMPDQAAYQLAGKFIPEIAAVMPDFTFSKQPAGESAIYKLSWDIKADSAPLNTVVFTTFAHNLTPDVLQIITSSPLD